jgi:hypothetical protein
LRREETETKKSENLRFEDFRFEIANLRNGGAAKKFKVQGPKSKAQRRKSQVQSQKPQEEGPKCRRKDQD